MASRYKRASIPKGKPDLSIGLRLSPESYSDMQIELVNQDKFESKSSTDENAWLVDVETQLIDLIT